MFSKEITKEVGNFHSIKVFSGLNVRLEPSTENKVRIRFSGEDNVIVKNVNGLLKLSIRTSELITNSLIKDIDITLYYKDAIQLIDANEGAVINSDAIIAQTSLEIRAQEGAKITLELKTTSLDVKSVTGGIITLKGLTEVQSVVLNTGGIYEATTLRSSSATVSSTSGGEANVNATDVLDAKVSLGGDIYYVGSPKSLNTKKSLGGRIKQL